MIAPFQELSGKRFSHPSVVCTILVTALLAFSGSAQARSLINLPIKEPIYEYGFENAFSELQFSEPVAIVTEPQETNRLYIVERQGRILVIPDLQNPVAQVFLDLTESTYSLPGECGLLGLAFHPDYKQNGRFFVYRTKNDCCNWYDVLSEFARNPIEPNEAMSSSERTLIKQRDGSVMHNAGDLQFGPDGYLYLSLGFDAPRGEDISEELQTIDRGFFGGIIRIDVDNRPDNLPPNGHPAISSQYRVPNDNPFIGASTFNGLPVDPSRVRTEFYAVGLRNPWRFTFHPETGALICADVGQGLYEEINVVEKGGNYGWPFFEANWERSPLPAREGLRESLKPPFYHYKHGYGSKEGRVVIGGRVYMGSQMPELRGKYLFADNASGNIWALDTTTTGAQPDWVTAKKGASSFAIDPRDGELLMANVVDGRIYKLVYVPPEEAGVPQTLAETGVFADIQSLIPRENLHPYSINNPFWSDGAFKQRWFSMGLVSGGEKMTYHPTENWTFPKGAVWVKHFELETTVGDVESRQRVETRIIVKTDTDVYGLAYYWPTPNEAVLAPPEGMERTYVIQDGNTQRIQRWQIPSWQQCKSCHTAAGGYAIGFSTLQLNRNESGGNYLQWLADNGYFSNPEAVAPAQSLRLFGLADANAPLQVKARSWLHSNCVQCHQPGGPNNMLWDARITTPLASANILMGRTVGAYQSLPVVTPGAAEESMLFHRARNRNSSQMPPFGTTVPDSHALALLEKWISTVPGPGWSSTNIGSYQMEGSAEEHEEKIVVAGSGLGMAENSVYFFHKPVSNFISLSGILLTNRSASPAVAEGGLMLRANTQPSTPRAALYVRGNRLFFVAGDNKSLSVIAEGNHSFPVHFKLQRTGGRVSAFTRSSEGSDWALFGTVIMELPEIVAGGLFSASGTETLAFNNAEFEDVEVQSRELHLSWSLNEGVLELTARHPLDEGIEVSFDATENFENWSPTVPEILTNTPAGGLTEKFYRVSVPLSSNRQFIRTRLKDLP